jgi:predicted MPP superfamily phosphohydrolase
VLFRSLHLKKQDPAFDALLAYLNEKAFDLGCCAGDIQHRSAPRMEISLKLARRLFDACRPRLGWYVVRGNNDHRRFLRRLAGPGVTVLDNRSVRLGHSTPPLCLAGVDDPHRGWHDVETAFRDVPRDAFRILLAHSPDVIHDAARFGAHLVLCGHTHGGQIRLPGVGALVTETRVSQKYCWGLSRKRGTLVFTTCGVGWTMIPLRLNCPAEVVSLPLRRGSGPHVDSSA